MTESLDESVKFNEKTRSNEFRFNQGEYLLQRDDVTWFLAIIPESIDPSVDVQHKNPILSKSYYTFNIKIENILDNSKTWPPNKLFGIGITPQKYWSNVISITTKETGEMDNM